MRETLALLCVASTLVAQAYMSSAYSAQADDVAVQPIRHRPIMIAEALPTVSLSETEHEERIRVYPAPVEDTRLPSSTTDDTSGDAVSN